MEITSQMVKDLREKTGVAMMECKRALEESQGDFEKAIEFLRKKGAAVAQKKSARATQEGLIEAYIHMGGKIGVLLQLNCETDFVARTDDFKELAHEVAMQVAAANPLYVRREEVPQDVLEKEKAIYRAQAAATKKPENVIEKIVEGKLTKFYEEACLLEQSYIKDDALKIQDLITQKVAKLGENITVGRFSRFKVGETDGKA